MYKGSQNEGFTLVEIIVTFAILGIFLAVAGNTFLFSNQIYTTTSQKDQEKYIGDAALSTIRNKITYATGIVVQPIGTDDQPSTTLPEGVGTWSDTQRLYIGTGDNAGDLILGKKADDFEEINVFGEDYYGGYILGYTLQKVDDYQLKVEVTVEDADTNSIVYTTTATVKSLTLEKKEVEIGVDTDTDATGVFSNPVLYFRNTYESSAYDWTEIDNLYNQYKTVYEFGLALNGKNITKAALDQSVLSDFSTYINPYNTTKNEYTAFQFKNNDSIREYLLARNGGEWPEFAKPSDEILDKPAYAYLKKWYTDNPDETLYIQPHEYNYTGADEILLFINTDPTGHAQWKGLLFIDQPNHKIYLECYIHPYQDRLEAQDINMTLTALKANAHDDVENWENYSGKSGEWILLE